MTRTAVRIAVFTISLVAPLATHAWGANGHRMVADLAYEALPPSTREQVRKLLEQEQGATLSSISTWADEVRSPSTAAWHYVNFQRGGGCHFSEEQNCPGGQCLVGAIDRQVEVLASSRPAGERLKALKWVVHLVADAHQPLHAGFSDDRGGNSYQVRAFGRGSNLHAVWDGGMIQNWPGGLSALRNHVMSANEVPQSTLSTRRWVEESCVIASTHDFYPEGRFITERYTDRWRGILALRLRTAADRLAKTLQRALP